MLTIEARVSKCMFSTGRELLLITFPEIALWSSDMIYDSGKGPASPTVEWSRILTETRL